MSSEKGPMLLEEAPWGACSMSAEKAIALSMDRVWVSIPVYWYVYWLLDTPGIPYHTIPYHTIPYPIPSGGYDTPPIPEYTYHTPGQEDRDPPASHTLIPYHTPIPSGIVSPRMYTIIYHYTAGAISTIPAYHTIPSYPPGGRSSIIFHTMPYHP